METSGYKKLIVWQKAMDLVVAVYECTKDFPKEELYGLRAQMQRAAISIPSNIAEGSRRGTRKDYRNFLLNAYGSASELETQVDISKRLGYVKVKESAKLEALLNEVLRMLNRMTSSLK